MIVYFIRGLPGSGKSSLARDIQEMAEAYADPLGLDGQEGTCPHFEADKWMTNEKGEYEFDFRKLPLANANCLAEYERAIRNKVGRIIVSNTSTSNANVVTYQDIAVAAGYEFVSIVVENRAGTKSIHNVPEETMARMLKKFELKL